jgi:hypothetical protein
VLAVVDAEVEGLNDVAVVQGDADARLVLEELRELLEVAEVGQDLLEGEALLEPRGAFQDRVSVSRAQSCPRSRPRRLAVLVGPGQ